MFSKDYTNSAITQKTTAMGRNCEIQLIQFFLAIYVKILGIEHRTRVASSSLKAILEECSKGRLKKKKTTKPTTFKRVFLCKNRQLTAANTVFLLLNFSTVA